MSVTYLYNGNPFPEIPDGWRGDYGCVCIFGPVSKPMLVACDDLYVAKLWPSGYNFIVQTGLAANVEVNAWQDPTEIVNYAFSYDSLIWSNLDQYGTEDGGETWFLVLAGSKPVPLPTYVLEATYTGRLIVTNYGATGTIIGAQLRDTDTDTVVDISERADYSIDALGADYAYLDENRQLIIDEDCPYSSVNVIVTWSELPDQSDTITIYIQIDDDGGGGGGGDTPDIPDVPDIPDIPEEEEDKTNQILLASLQLGIAIGMALEGWFIKSRPAMLQYNSELLAELPEVSEEWYPYRYITKSAEGTYDLYFSSEELAVSDSNMLVPKTSLEVLGQTYHTADPSNWGIRSTIIFTTAGVALPFWCNQDLKYLDGTVYLAASQPIPQEGLWYHLKLMR